MSTVLNDGQGNILGPESSLQVAPINANVTVPGYDGSTYVGEFIPPALYNTNSFASRFGFETGNLFGGMIFIIFLGWIYVFLTLNKAIIIYFKKGKLGKGFILTVFTYYLPFVFLMALMMFGGLSVMYGSAETGIASIKGTPIEPVLAIIGLFIYISPWIEMFFRIPLAVYLVLSKKIHLEKI